MLKEFGDLNFQTLSTTSTDNKDKRTEPAKYLIEIYESIMRN